MEILGSLAAFAWLVVTCAFVASFVPRLRDRMTRRIAVKRLRLGLGGAFVVLLLVIAATAPPEAGSPRKRSAASPPEQAESQAAATSGHGPAHKGNPESIEYELATIDASGYVPDDDIRVARFKSLLQQLSQTYSGTPQQIGDQTVKAHEMLKDRGVQESLVNIMTGMNQIFTTANHKQDYAGALTIYIGLRNKGESNSEAFRDLQDLVAHLGG